MNMATKDNDFAAAAEAEIGDCLAGGAVTGIRTSTPGRSARFTHARRERRPGVAA
jgi:hypothetical protein